MKAFNSIIELITLLIIAPIIIIYRLLIVLFVFAFLASPVILLGWLIWLIVA